MTAKKGAGIVFGKISVFGEESLDKCASILDRVMKKHGYPEQFSTEEDDDIPTMEELDEEEKQEREEQEKKEEQEVPAEEPPWMKEMRQRAEESVQKRKSHGKKNVGDEQDGPADEIRSADE